MQTTAFLPNTRNTNKEKKHNHIPTSQQTTDYINTRQGRTPETYIGRRATQNRYTQIKTQEKLFKFNDLTF
jgi:hypothetical protein